MSSEFILGLVLQLFSLYEYLSMISELDGVSRDLVLVDNHNPRKSRNINAHVTRIFVTCLEAVHVI